MLRGKRTFAVAAVAAATIALLPGGASAARPGRLMSSCQARSLGTHSEFGQFVAVAGAYKGPADALDVHLTCGIVRFGVTIDRVQDPLTGPVAALADLRVVGRGLVTSCYEIKIVHVSGGVTYYDTCP